ncbi:hypothetical protein [Argonema antarcticum]|nr:hypothetical protein [Argonema antarcticum]MCL1471313.1 hypothetical protein [Argonema antarcticum A004/B2]
MQPPNLISQAVFPDEYFHRHRQIGMATPTPAGQRINRIHQPDLFD